MDAKNFTENTLPDTNTISEYEVILTDLDSLHDDLTRLASEMACATITGASHPQASLPSGGTDPVQFAIAARKATTTALAQAAEAESYVNHVFSLMVTFSFGYGTSRFRPRKMTDLAKTGTS